MSNKLNLVIDFNNIAFRAMFTCSYAGGPAGEKVSTFDTDAECAVLARKITIDLSFILRTFLPDRTVIVCDARNPWRNEIYGEIDGETYKGTRVKDETKNWVKIYETFNELKDQLSSFGFMVLEVESAEADDLAAMLKGKLFNESGENIIMVSSDKDWSQLIEFDSGSNAFCIGYNPIVSSKSRRKLYVSDGFSAWLESPDPNDIFFTGKDQMKERMKEIIRKDQKIELEQVNPERILLEKIICGDDGDNVPGFYEFFKNGKKVRFTELRMNKLFELGGVSGYDSLRQACESGAITESISKLFKREADDFDPGERFFRQCRLVELKPALFPEKIRADFEKRFGACSCHGYVDRNAKMEDILKGSKFVSKDYGKRVRENSIFDDLKDLEKFVKPSGLF